MSENRKHTSQRDDKELQFRHAEHLRDIGMLSLDVLRADKLREVLEHLYHVNERVPIVVEGKRDIEALRILGFSGEILALHGRLGLYEFAEGIHEHYSNIVLLLDWDDKGETLQSRMRALLPGLWEEHAPIRESLINLCQKDIRDVQSLPSLLDRLAGTRVLFPESAEDRETSEQ